MGGLGSAGPTGEDLAGSVDTEYGERREESLEQPAPGTSAGAAGEDRPETTEDTGAGSPAPGGNYEQADAGEQGAGSLRVFKRVRTGQ